MYERLLLLVPYYFRPIIFLTLLANFPCNALIVLKLLNFLFPFAVRKWRIFFERCNTFPFFVTLNRFAADLRVFVLTFIDVV